MHYGNHPPGPVRRTAPAEPSGVPHLQLFGDRVRIETRQRHHPGRVLQARRRRADRDPGPRYRQPIPGDEDPHVGPVHAGRRRGLVHGAGGRIHRRHVHRRKRRRPEPRHHGRGVPGGELADVAAAEQGRDVGVAGVSFLLLRRQHQPPRPREILPEERRHDDHHRGIQHVERAGQLQHDDEPPLHPGIPDAVGRLRRGGRLGRDHRRRAAVLRAALRLPRHTGRRARLPGRELPGRHRHVHLPRRVPRRAGSGARVRAARRREARRHVEGLPPLGAVHGIPVARRGEVAVRTAGVAQGLGDHRRKRRAHRHRRRQHAVLRPREPSGGDVHLPAVQRGAAAERQPNIRAAADNRSTIPGRRDFFFRGAAD